VRNYTETGFLKIKAPEAVFSLVKEFWENNKDEQTVEWKHPSSYHNTWDAPTTIIRVDNTSLKGGGPQLYAAIANAARDAMEVSVFRRDQVGAE
jgi:prolyl 4-hydroxylase